MGLRTSKEIASNRPWRGHPDGASVLVALRPEGWAAEARKAFLDMTEGPVVVQDSRDDFLDWDRVRNLDAVEIPALVTLRDGAVRELPENTAVRQPASPRTEAGSAGRSHAALRTSYERAKGTEYTVVRL